MPNQPLQELLGGRRGQHSRGRGDPFPLAKVIPVVLVAAVAVAVAIYAITGGFSSASATRPPSVSAHTGLSTIPTTSLAAPTTSAPSSTTSQPTTSTTVATTTTSTTTPPTTTAPPVTVPPSQVLVEVLSGNGQPSEATTVASALRTVGFGINGTGNANTFEYTASKITYAPGSATAAATLGAHISGAYSLAVDDTLPAGVVYLTVGSDYSGVRD